MVMLTEAPADRDVWLAERRKRLGATDVSAILGVNPYKTAYEVWLEKRGMLEDWEGNAATELGNDLEPVLLDKAERIWGKLKRQVVVYDALSPVASTLDGWLIEQCKVVECKTGGMTSEFADLSHWDNEEETKLPIPVWYWVQMQCQLMGTETSSGYILAIIGGRGYRQYEIDRHDAVIDGIRRDCNAWWTKHITGVVDPETGKVIQEPVEPAKDTLPDIEVLKRIKREPNKSIVLPSNVLDIANEWEIAKDVANRANDYADKLKARLIAELGDAEAGILPDGRMLTYLESSRKGYEVKPTTYRTLRIKKG